MIMLESGARIVANTTISISAEFAVPVNELVILEDSGGAARPGIFTLMLQTHDADGLEILRVIPLVGVASEQSGPADLVSGTFDPLPPGTHRWILRSSVATTVHVAARPPSMENAPEVGIGLFPVDGRMAESLLAHLDAQAGLDEHAGRSPRWSVVRIWGVDAPEILASGTPIIILGDSPHDDAVVTLLAARAEEPPAPTFFYSERDPAAWGALIDWCRAQELAPDEEGS